jgi:hypothetical protein
MAAHRFPVPEVAGSSPADIVSFFALVPREQHLY